MTITETGAPLTADAPAPWLQTELPGPVAREIIARDEAVTSPSLTRVYPLVVRRGRGCVLEDVDGNRFLDFNAGIAVVAAGHGHPAVRAAIHAQVDDVVHYCSSDFYLPAYADLCERLAALAPMPDARVFLSNSGTEAVEAALKLARHHTGRPNAIAFFGVFHGRSLGSLSLTASKARQRAGFGIVTPGAFHAPYADPYDPVARTGAAYIEQVLFRTVTDPGDVAAIFVEPVQGEGGYIVPPAGWLADLRRLCDEHGILLVLDEVQTGVGRTGTMWACEHDGIEPDVMCIGKGLASGLPLAGVIARAAVMDWAPGAHGSTFGGNPVACAAASATLDLVTRGLAANAALVGAHLLDGLRTVAAERPVVQQIRGRGLMIGIDLPDHDTAAALELACFDRGLLLLTCGERSVRLAPPLVVTIEQADTALDILADAPLGGLVTAPLPTTSALVDQVVATLDAVGVAPRRGDLGARTPITGGSLGAAGSAGDVDATVERATAAFTTWRTTPAPVRGQLVQRLGELLRQHKDDLGQLVSIEAGKIRSEGLGEVQEMIDICDFAVGLSRQLHGLTIASERPQHRLMETWHPMGPCAVITAFNFPVAVWSWNAALALVAGDPVVWKPSDKTPLTALACDALLQRAARDVGAPGGLNQVVLGGSETGAALAAHEGVAIVSATGSTRMGRAIAPVVASRFGRLILELGGNNGAIVAPSADLELAVRAIAFSAVGTAGQRCTSLRRLVVHRSVRDELLDRLAKAFASVPIGDPLRAGTLVGPLIDGPAFDRVADAITTAAADGGEHIVGGDRVLAADAPDAFYVSPAIVAMEAQTELVRTETFGPLLYVLGYDDLDEAIAMHNDVPQGLASSIFTNDLREAERFLAADGSDCGIANVNIGPSGAEIGGAFGGEKDTGGGRESGSDAWKAYMRRATNTINFGTTLPLAQGVEFRID